jgi:hypothetical protein
VTHSAEKSNLESEVLQWFRMKGGLLTFQQDFVRHSGVLLDEIGVVGVGVRRDALCGKSNVESEVLVTR